MPRPHHSPMFAPLAILALLTAGALAAASASAQTHAPMRLLVPSSLLNTLPPESERDQFANVAEFFDHFAVFADGQECGRFSLVDPALRDDEDNAVYALAQADQHPYCATPKALVTLIDRNGFTLDEKWTIEPGSTVVVDNFAPEPAHGAATSILIPVFMTRSPDTAARFGHFTVFADGQVCGIISLTQPELVDQQGNLLFLLGTGEQPEACGREGALIYFKDRNGTVLLTTLALEPGKTHLFRNFAPPPPVDPGPPGPPDAGTGIADADGGVASRDLRTTGLVLLAAALAMRLGMVCSRRWADGRRQAVARGRPFP